MLCLMNSVSKKDKLMCCKMIYRYVCISLEYWKILRMSLEYLKILNLTEISKFLLVIAYTYALNHDQIRKLPQIKTSYTL